MQYFVTFLEGILTFISPCLLPMLPIYLAWFAGSSKRERAWVNVLGFILGFTIVFVSLGAFSGVVGSLLTVHQTAVNLVTGGIVVLFGLSYMGILPMAFRGGVRFAFDDRLGFLQAVLFGVVLSISQTPCIGTFLGSALMLASRQGHVREGMLLLFLYSMGLGIPYLLCTLLMDQLRTTIQWIKVHYAVINQVCGVFLVVIGLLMATGVFGLYLSLLN